MGPRRFDIFIDKHFGIGIRWRKSSYYSGYDVSFSIPFVSVVICFGKLEFQD